MYLIDGYNLFYNTDYENQAEMIGALDRYANYYGKDIKIVFDGFCPDNLSTYNVLVEFAGDADARIMEILQNSSDPSRYVIISSDNEIRQFAKGLRYQVIRSEDFDFRVYENKNDEPLEKRSNVYLSDEEVKRQLKEFNGFKKSTEL